eukprot:COSAG05_NODE_8580_length_691_cov_0.932432_2_plen_83_part_00
MAPEATWSAARRVSFERLAAVANIEACAAAAAAAGQPLPAGPAALRVRAAACISLMAGWLLLAASVGRRAVQQTRRYAVHGQ